MPNPDPMSDQNPAIHEKQYASNKWKPPVSIRPTRELLEVYDRWIARTAERRGARMLILGSTPELRDLALAHGLVPVSCDHSPVIWESMKALMTQRGPEEFLQVNWLEIPEAHPYDLVAGDGSLVMLRPDQIEPMLLKIAKLLAPTGAALLKVGVRSRPFAPKDFTDAVAEYRRTRPPMSLHEYVLILVTELRSDRYVDWTLRELWERVLFAHLTPEEIAEVRPCLLDARFYTPTKADFERMAAGCFTVEQVVEAKGPGQWGTTHLYVLRPVIAAGG
ncbi:MAG: hypothetical protein KJ726_09105 [Verrucomicrobia bacterium]|nr:hypothetical protein [Verrucomicrobiota bacterium]MBU1910194.1 hypothetical protein [Verrucomicrobiota bacterium]